MKKSMVLLAFFCLACAPEAPTLTLGELPDISSPHSVLIADSELVFLDGYAALIYSLNPLELKHSFAGEGDGDHQFLYWPRLGLHGETIFGLDYMKTSWFTRQGELLRTIRYTEFEDFDPGREMVLEPAGDNYVRVTVDHNSSRRYVQLFDRDLRLIATLYEGLFDWQGALPAFRIDVAVGDGHIFISDSEKGFFIRIFDTQGNLVRTIDKSADMERIPFTEADRVAYVEWVRLNEPSGVYERISQNPRFKDHYPMINNVQVDGGKLYVTTERRLDDKHEIVILDLDGTILKTLYVPLKSKTPSRRILRFDPYVIHEGSLYEIARNDSTGVFELLVTELN